MDVSFCIAALEDALARHEKPEIFNTDQGSQFTSAAFTSVLADMGITISMDGKGAWRVSSVCGEASNTRRCTCGHTRA
jgi:putative transposase